MKDVRKLFSCLFRRVPTNGNYLVILLNTINGHGHVVVRCHDLEEVVTEALLQELRVLGE
jgi:hypothetical protein